MCMFYLSELRKSLFLDSQQPFKCPCHMHSPQGGESPQMCLGLSLPSSEEDFMNVLLVLFHQVLCLFSLSISSVTKTTAVSNVDCGE